jgi:hypothetical protein
VTYDVSSDRAIRAIHVAGTLRFATDRDTRLDVGLIKIQAGDDASEDGFDCEAHMPQAEAGSPRPALEVGTPNAPIPADHTALIRLVAIDGMDLDTCPAIVCCGGRMDFHGAPLVRTWVKLGRTARAGDSAVTLAEPVPGWRTGGRVIVTATQRLRRERGTLRTGADANPIKAFTEERTIGSVEGNTLTLDRPLDLDHLGDGDYRGEVALLSRNVVVESADKARGSRRGHTMYHRNSVGSVRYAEFRHLGKEGIKGRYSLHFHLVGDTMRGTAVVGASIWDSGNRWITVHGTNYLVIRDCVGYQSVGHGFFLEDGTEVDNVLDRNLAVQAFAGKPVPEQVLPFDNNSGAGFWWANSRNSFTRNVAVECDRYGYRFEAKPVRAFETALRVEEDEGTPEDFDLRLPVRQPGGERTRVDIRTLPFVRFEGNEAHSQLYGINLGEGVRGVGPDARHPFILRDTLLWNDFWALRPASPSVMVDGMEIEQGNYGLYRAVFDHHAYRRLTVGGVQFPNRFGQGKKPGSLDLVESASPPPSKELAEKRAAEFKAALARGDLRPFTMNPLAPVPDLPRASVSTADFPAPLEPVDDLPPSTVITDASPEAPGEWTVRGTTADGGTVERVSVNGRNAVALRPNFAEWQVIVSLPEGGGTLSAFARDAAGNVESRPHEIGVSRP